MSLFAIKDINTTGKALRPYYVVLDIFAKMFISADEDCDTLDFVAKASKEMELSHSEEAKYALSVIERFNIAKEDFPLSVADASLVTA